jgi:hypothetical protein
VETLAVLGFATVLVWFWWKGNPLATIFLTLLAIVGGALLAASQAGGGGVAAIMLALMIIWAPALLRRTYLH